MTHVHETCVHCVDKKKLRLPIHSWFIFVNCVGGLLWGVGLTCLNLFSALSVQLHYLPPLDLINGVGVAYILGLGFPTLFIYFRHNMWGQRLYCSLDTEDNLHIHLTEDEVMLKHGGTSCKFWNRNPTSAGRLTMRGPGTVILELCFGWLRGSTIYGQPSLVWEHGVVRGNHLIIEDVSSDRLAIEVLTKNLHDHKSSLIEPHLKRILVILRHHKVLDLLELGVTAVRDAPAAIKMENT